MEKRNMIAALLCSACLVAGSVNPCICRCIEGSNTWSRSYGCSEADNDEIF